MKAPIFSAYAPRRAAAAATLETLAGNARPAGPPAAPTTCPQCNGAGCRHDVPPGQPVRSGDIYECYHCEGSGQVPAPNH